MKTVLFENSKFFPIMLEKMREESATGTIFASGYSMRPFIEDKRDKLVFAMAANIKPGDVILAELQPGRYVCHRVESIDCKRVVMRGDGNVPNKKRGFSGVEIFTPDKIRAKLVQIIRKGKTYDLETSRTWKIYSAVWTRLLPVRRPLLLLYRLLWLHELPTRLTKHFNHKKT